MEQIENALYLVATPIGNLAEITYRAVHILNSVDLIAAEDTRTSSVLLGHYGINTKMVSYHAHNIPAQTPKLVQKLQAGHAVALISDAGTPGISDPGYHLVLACKEVGIRVVPIAGATAFVAAVTASGLPTQHFVYEGFLPHKKGRQTRLQFLKNEPRTLLFYESPHRIEKTVRQLYESWGNRKCVIAREISKKFEEFISGDFETVLDRLTKSPIKGEIVLVVEGTGRLPKEKKEKKEYKKNDR